MSKLYPPTKQPMLQQMCRGLLGWPDQGHRRRGGDQQLACQPGRLNYKQEAQCTNFFQHSLNWFLLFSKIIWKIDHIISLSWTSGEQSATWVESSSRKEASWTCHWRRLQVTPKDPIRRGERMGGGDSNIIWWRWICNIMQYQCVKYISKCSFILKTLK